MSNYQLRSKGDCIPENARSTNSSIITEQPSKIEDMTPTAVTQPSNAEIMDLLTSVKDKLSILDTLKEDLTQVKSDISNINTTITGIDNRVTSLEKAENSNRDEFNNVLKEHEIKALVSEYNSKEFNVIIYNLPLIGKSETLKASRKKSLEVLEKVLQIYDANDFIIRNAHRLPGKAGKCPSLIFKISTMFEKQKIWDKIKLLNNYNNSKEDNEKIFIDMIHLPKKLKDDKNDLLEDFKAAKKAGKKPRWRFMKKTREYCYAIGNTTFIPKTINFTQLS